MDISNNLSILICNISKKGLGKNLCNQIIILQNKPKYIILISCKEKSLKQDYDLLKKIYKINNHFIVKTNYNIFITIFELKL